LNKKILFFLGIPKTLRFNFHYFPFKIAIRLPVWLTHRVRLKSLNGKVMLKADNIRRGMVTIGFRHVSINDVNEYSLWNVEGTVIFNSSAGAKYGNGCIIGANSFVNKVFNQNNCIIAGNPARIVKENVYRK